MTDRPEALRTAMTQAIDYIESGMRLAPTIVALPTAVATLRAALATPDPAPSSEGGLDVEGFMDAEHRWCVQVEGEWALGHEVEAHRKQAEFILARLRDAP